MLLKYVLMMAGVGLFALVTALMTCDFTLLLQCQRMLATGK
jgi:hypothetical protein